MAALSRAIRLSMSSDIPLSIFVGLVDPTPLGPLYIAVTQYGLVGVEFQEISSDMLRSLEYRLERSMSRGAMSLGPADNSLPMQPLTESQADLYAETACQLSDYLHGKRREFDLPIDWRGMTPFQEQALHQTLAIPYGQTSTYVEIARQMGRPKAARAVGRAEATNPMPLVIPCHRVLGSDGGLHGYSGRGGLQTKAWLLELEKNTP